MQTPNVSFIVPCYKLGHLLSECLESILSQTYADFEVLVMDDCSPDNTPEVARYFRDSRVRYIRNENNLGHLRNYNKGIGLSRGQYVWLISADDRLRRPYILERYVRLMDACSNIGYVCCPGIGLKDGLETGVVDCGHYGTRDKIFNGRKFIAASLERGYGLLAPSVMVRKACYEEISLFPLDMPHQGDWYLWFRWALDYDVAYISEPMVYYRSHDLSIMTHFMTQAPQTLFNDEINLLWRTRRHCQERGLAVLAKKCENALIAKYARAALSRTYRDVSSHIAMSIVQCRQSLRANASTYSELKRLQGNFAAYVGNEQWWHGDLQLARRSYGTALRDNWKMPTIWLKFLLVLLGLQRTRPSAEKADEAA